MKKYKLINTKINEEHLCDKVTIDGFDYYVGEEKLQIGDYLQRNNDLPVLYTENFWFDFGVPYKKVIATTNPNIDVPKVVDEIDIMREKLVETYLEKIKDVTKRFFWKAGFKHGYKKSQETHPFSENDVLMFDEWKNKNYKPPHNDGIYVSVTDYYNVEDLKSCQYYTTKELFKIWKEQQPKIVYYVD